jgi:hypothetical protein
VFWICSREVEPLSAAIKSFVRELG